jgi:hypothetical protein
MSAQHRMLRNSPHEAANASLGYEASTRLGRAGRDT